MYWNIRFVIQGEYTIDMHILTFSESCFDASYFNTAFLQSYMLIETICM